MRQVLSSHITASLLAAMSIILLTIGIFSGYFKADIAGLREGKGAITKSGSDLIESSFVKSSSVKNGSLKSSVKRDVIRSVTVTEEPAFKKLKQMGRGVNILGYDGIWDSPSFNPFKPDYFAMIRKAGFGHVRINVHAFEFMDDSHRLAPHFFKRLDKIIKLTVKAGLVPVIDEHNVSVCQKSPNLCAVRLQAFWRQLVTHYHNRYPSIVFELLNEPGGNMTKQAWNRLILKTLGIIRATSPTRTVIIAAINDGDPYMVHDLKLPKSDRNIIVTVHYYKPFNFTHQGAPWANLGKKIGIGWGTQTDKKAIAKDFNIIADWARAHHRPIYLGEFGVYEKADIGSSTKWLAFVTAEANRLGWHWAYWQFDHDFKLYDPEKNRWKQHRLNAIMRLP